MLTAVIELHFLPSLEYFCALSSSEKIILERHENFIKQTYRNRCYILAANQPERITLPLTTRHGKILITDIQLDAGIRWRTNFWRTVTSAYTKAPYFEHYADDLKSLLFSKHKFLYDLNLEILSMCLKWLRWKKEVDETAGYEKNYLGDVADLRNQISAKKEYSERLFYKVSQYQQVFGNTFVPNLSIIDLVFCEGPRAAAVIEDSRRRN